MSNPKITYLIQVLQDKSIDLGARDDAAMDLEDYDDPEVLDVLVNIASNENENEMILESCGESIKAIWLRGSIYSSEKITKELFDQLAPAARRECNIDLENRNKPS